uniref:Uncharacterized protein n=1 Tax=Aegilops tauschii TaxID=37682 RepID=M8BKV6_AEGTA
MEAAPVRARLLLRAFAWLFSLLALVVMATDVHGRGGAQDFSTYPEYKHLLPGHVDHRAPVRHGAAAARRAQAQLRPGPRRRAEGGGRPRLRRRSGGGLLADIGLVRGGAGDDGDHDGALEMEITSTVL